MILGDKGLWMPIELAAAITSSASSVGRLLVKDGDGIRWVMTAFLVHRDLAITTSHGFDDADGSLTDCVIDFESVESEGDRSHDAAFLAAGAYPWADAAAGELHSLLTDAYLPTESRLGILAMAGVPQRNLQQDGTPNLAWRQALDVTARMGLMGALVDQVLADPAVAGFHSRIEALLPGEQPSAATPVAMDVEGGWTALRLDTPSSRPPLALGSSAEMKPGDGVIIVQHPGARFKQFAVEPDGLIKATDTQLFYRVDTAGGASGAPVFNDRMEVVGVHHSVDTETRAANIGMRIDVIIEGLLRHGLDFVSAGDTGAG